MVIDPDELILQVTEFRSTETDVYTSERPMTLSRPDTSTTMRYDSAIILCISEGRSIQSEIGTASLNLKTSECILSQYTDSSSFPYTFHKLAVLQPGVILMASTCIDPPSKAYQVLEPTMEKRSDVISVPRNYFNYSMGLESVQHFQLKEGGAEEEFISRISDKYYALAALSALFKYIHEMHNILFESHSIRFKYTNIEGTMFIDASTSAQLELIFNSKNPLSKYSLLGILDKTKTAMGTRLIRASILQPLVGIMYLM
jgi:DNA mismatch repair protein MSH4